MRKALHVSVGRVSRTAAAIGGEINPAATESQEGLCSTVPDQKESWKGHTIDSRLRQSHFNLRSAIYEASKIQAAKRSGVQPVAVDSPTDSGEDELGAASNVSEGRSMARAVVAWLEILTRVYFHGLVRHERLQI